MNFVYQGNIPMETVALPNGYENNINSGDNEYNTNQLNKDIGSNNGINASNLSKENNLRDDNNTNEVKHQNKDHFDNLINNYQKDTQFPICPSESNQSQSCENSNCPEKDTLSTMSLDPNCPMCVYTAYQKQLSELGPCCRDCLLKSMPYVEEMYYIDQNDPQYEYFLGKSGKVNNKEHPENGVRQSKDKKIKKQHKKHHTHENPEEQHNTQDNHENNKEKKHKTKKHHKHGIKKKEHKLPETQGHPDNNKEPVIEVTETQIVKEDKMNPKNIEVIDIKTAELIDSANSGKRGKLDNDSIPKQNLLNQVIDSVNNIPLTQPEILEIPINQAGVISEPISNVINNQYSNDSNHNRTKEQEYKNEIKELKSKLELFIIDNARLKLENEELINTVKESKFNINELNREIAILAEMKEKNKNTGLGNNDEQYMAIIRDLKEENMSLNHQLNQIKEDERRNIIEIQDRYDEKIKELEGEIEKQRDLCQNPDVNSLLSQIDLLKKNIELLSIKLAEKEQNIEELSNKNNLLNNDKKEVSDRHMEILNDLKFKIDNLEQRLNNLYMKVRENDNSNLTTAYNYQQYSQPYEYKSEQNEIPNMTNTNINYVENNNNNNENIISTYPIISSDPVNDLSAKYQI